MINPRLFPKGSHDQKTLIKILFCLLLLKQESPWYAERTMGFRVLKDGGANHLLFLTGSMAGYQS